MATIDSLIQAAARNEAGPPDVNVEDAHQVTGKPDPRDNGEGPADEAAGSELVELGDSPLPSRLDVPPASVRSLGRRLDPRLAAGVAVAIVVVALLGTGPLAPRPTTTPSPSRIASEPSAPAPTDACPVNPVDPPIVTLGLLNTNLTRTPAAGVGPSIEAVDVVAPVTGATSVHVGRRMQLKIPDVSCLELLGIDLFDAGRPRGSALTVRAPSLLEPGASSVMWDGPPAGDWIVRVALHLRTPGGESASVWAVYLFRLNSGNVAWSSPVPTGFGDGGTAEVPLVTPAVPCGPAPDGPTPPVVELVAAGATVPGTLGSYKWQGSELLDDHVPDALLAATPVEMPVPHTLLIADSACATTWSIVAGSMPIAGEPFGWGWHIDGSPENALQNTFAFPTDVYGTYVIQASFTFLSGDHETVYWYVHADLPPVPQVQMLAAPSGDAVTLAVGGCGAWQSARAQAAPLFELGGRLGTEICGSSASQTPDLPTLTVAAESVLRLAADGHVITSWSVTHVDREDLDPLPCWAPLVSGSSSFGVASLEIPTLPPGDWTLQVSLTLTDGADSSSVPYLVHLAVLGPETPSPSCEPYDVG